MKLGFVGGPHSKLLSCLHHSTSHCCRACRCGVPRLSTHHAEVVLSVALTFQPFMLQYNSLLYLYTKDFFPWKNSIKSYNSNSGSLIEVGAVVAEIWANLWVIFALGVCTPIRTPVHPSKLGISQSVLIGLI